jgi:predicted NBD/HSP70 family sugar kinase
VDPRTQGRLAPMILPAWAQVDVEAALRAHFDLPIVIDNDANLGAVAERWWGAGRGGEDLAYIKLGTGVGGGHILNGEIYRGAHGIAGELSHLSLGSDGPPCVCGQRGCLVRHLGADALREKASARRAEFPATLLASANFSLADLTRAAHAGDALALSLARDAARDLGAALVSLLNLLNPEIVVLGGQLALLGDLLLEPTRAYVRQRTLWPVVGETPIVISGLGQRGIALGAATALLAELLKAPELMPGASQWVAA